MVFNKNGQALRNKCSNLNHQRTNMEQIRAMFVEKKFTLLAK